jgi:hypothetical protein
MSRLPLVRKTIKATARGARLGTVLPLGPTVRLYGGTDKRAHGFVPGYVDHIRARRWHPNRLVEIGVGGYEARSTGGSLRVWRDHLPRSTIVGFDLHDKDVALGPRVRFVRGDQSVPADLDKVIEALGGPPDIVIDDGSHLAGHARISFDHLFPLMPPGSLYVIEDLHTSYWTAYGGDVPAPDDTAVGLIRSLVDAVQAGDPTFVWRPEHRAPPPVAAPIRSLDVRPGIAFVVRA